MCVCLCIWIILPWNFTKMSYFAYSLSWVERKYSIRMRRFRDNLQNGAGQPPPSPTKVNESMYWKEMEICIFGCSFAYFCRANAQQDIYLHDPSALRQQRCVCVCGKGPHLKWSRQYQICIMSNQSPWKLLLLPLLTKGSSSCWAVAQCVNVDEYVNQIGSKPSEQTELAPNIHGWIDI